MRTPTTLSVVVIMICGCGGAPPPPPTGRTSSDIAPASESASGPRDASVAVAEASTEPSRAPINTCAGAYASYWNDPSNTPPEGAPHVFRLSQAFPKDLPPEESVPWLRFNPFNVAQLPERQAQAHGYINAVLEYIFEGNIGAQPSDTDFDLCSNPVRPWFHVPWMDANPSKGREYVHGLTRELAPSPQKLAKEQANTEAAWAVGFYNARGAYAIGTVFPGGSADAVVIPAAGFKFPSGTVVGKALFTTASPTIVPYLQGAPKWSANILPPPCGGRFTGTAQGPGGTTVKCTRALTDVYLAQFDVAVVDPRAPLGWVFGTFVYDGRENSTLGFRGLKPVGLMWGNDPTLQRSGGNPDANAPAQRGLTSPELVHESVMFTQTLPDWLQKDLGCAGRLDGPIDNPRSSCMSCHASASVPVVVEAQQKNPCTGTAAQQRTVVVAPIMGDFSTQCGNKAIDAVWFRNIPAGQAMTDPSICNGQAWISVDYSLQVSQGITNYFASKATPPPPPPAAPSNTLRSNSRRHQGVAPVFQLQR